MTPRTAAVALLTTLLFGSSSMAQDDVLKTLDRNHPRLILKDAEVAGLKARLDKDALLKKSVDALVKNADAVCAKPMLKRELIGPRLLSVSRECVSRMYTLGLAWRLTGEAKYADAARANLLAVCAFDDWNPSHFLDVAEMTHAVGIGYDWFYSAFDDATRATIRAGLVKNGLTPGAAAYAPGRGRAWWVASDFNWNQVCNGGLIIGALAVAETDGEWARKIVPAAVASLPKALASYAPDGAWGEGPGYWQYATEYTVYALAALQSALGTDFGLGDAEGFREAGWFPIHMTGPTGLTFNFADAGEQDRRRNIPCLFWLANRFSVDAFAEAEREMMDKRPGDPLDLIWYARFGPLLPPPQGEGRERVKRPMEETPDAQRPGSPLAAAPLCARFRGPVEVVTMRAAWDDPNALFVAVKAGYNQVNHGHLDLGTFVLDALGVRWARDLGSDDYNLPGYWDGKSPSGKRWTYYRLGSLSHNIPLVGDRNQWVNAKAKIEKYETAPERTISIVDLTAAYPPEAKSARRGIAMLERRRVFVQDEFEMKQPCDFAWGMTTGAEIALDGNKAVLREGGKELRAEILSPAGAVFSVESAEQKPPQKENKGIRRLMIRLKAPAGALRVAVLFTPAAPGGKSEAAPTLKPLEQW
jgi:hypothetical protein